MKITVQIKQLGKKHPLLDNELIELKTLTSPTTVRDFIQAVVTQQVEVYNRQQTTTDDDGKAKSVQVDYLPLLIDTGKISFGERYHDQKADLADAIDVAIQAFEDGLYTIFKSDDQLDDLSQTIQIQEEENFSFIRLTFLAGSYW